MHRQRRTLLGTGTLLLLCSAIVPSVLRAADLPTLPARDGSVSIPAQEWPLRPGPREITVYLHYPQGALENVGPGTGLMLTIHNWGGTECRGTANPQQLANRYNVVAICVDYLQSGKEGYEGPEPYDFGYLQALDVLRALHYVYDGLKQKAIPFAKGRIYATGGSGGGNVSLMANKLAPRTFACIIDMCGMARLNDDIAFNLPGGSSLNARYSRDPESPNYLDPGAQELRYIGNPAHLAKAKEIAGEVNQIVVVHGTEDTACPFADAREMVDHFREAGWKIDAHFLTKEDLDGTVFTSAGHALGNRTLIVFRVADKYLLPDSPEAVLRTKPNDFETRDERVQYPTTTGTFVISYSEGYPVGRFEPAKSSQ